MEVRGRWLVRIGSWELDRGRKSEIGGNQTPLLGDIPWTSDRILVGFQPRGYRSTVIFKR